MTEPSPKLPALVVVVAMTTNRVIGKDNGIPWNLPEDRKHFVAITRGHALIMGRATFDSIGKPLPKRRNIIITRNRRLDIDGAEIAHSLDEAIALAREDDDAPRVVGGAQVYAEALPFATRIYLTEIDAEIDGDVFFPVLDPATWKVVDSRRGDRATYKTLERTGA